MAFASFFRSRNSRRPATPPQLEQAIKPVVENLEARLLLSTSRHRTTLVPSEIISGGSIGTGFGAPSATSVTQIAHLYGVDQLDAISTTNPLFTNSGQLQNIVVIGAPVTWINDEGTKQGNLHKFSTGEGIAPGGVFEDPIAQSGFNPIPNRGDGGIDDLETTAMIEWAHALAPLAAITLVEVPVTPSGVVAPADLSLGIQEAVRVAQQNSSTGPVNGSLPGGVVLMGLTSRGEDATISAMYDSLFAYKGAKNISFIAPTGEFGGTVSMPASSPYVTAVGGTTFSLDAAGNRQYEIASLNAGGGASGVEALPAFQSGLRANGVRLRTRGVPDISLAARSIQGGLDMYWDPTDDRSDPLPWGAIEGTAGSAAAFTGMVADANELRWSNGLGPVGRDLNNELYAAYRNNPNVVHDITQGNNTLFQSGAGYDLATGLGTPQANFLIPALAGVSTQNASANLTGDVFLANNGNTGNLVIPLRGTASVEIGTQFVTISNFRMIGAQTDPTSGTTTTFTATFTPTGLMALSGSTVSGFGTVTLTGGGQSETFNVALSGKISGSRNRARKLNASIVTVNSRGKKIPFGAQDVFQATLSM